jgi:c-di-GMP-binding flagellar brake protein YcgR
MAGRPVEPDGIDRRQHERTTVKVPLYISLDGEVYQKMVEIESQNISVGGLYFETHREIPVQSQSRVMVSRLGDLPDSAHIEATVMHCHRDPATGAFYIGLKFTSFNGVTPEELRTKIDTWKREEEARRTRAPIKD